MACNTRTANRQPVRRRRRCSEECLRRIAVRLCSLDNHRTNAVVDGDHAGSITEENDIASQENKVTCEDKCCEKPVTPNGSSIDITPGQDNRDVSSTCAHGCCGEAELSSSALESDSRRSDGCCGRDETTPNIAVFESGCSDLCCDEGQDAPKATAPSSSYSGGCCDDKSVTAKASGPGCSSGCCVKQQASSSSVKLKPAACCDSPALAANDPESGCRDDCCNEDNPMGQDMIDNSTIAKCSKESTKDTVTTTWQKVPDESKSECEGVQLNACSSHLRAAFDRFQALLAKSRCICRTVAQEIGICCCSLDSNGAVAVSDNCNTLGEHTGRSTGISILAEPSSDSSMRQRAATCCEKSKQTDFGEGATLLDGCTDDSCGSGGRSGIVQSPPLAPCLIPNANTRPGPDDVENAAAREHIVLNVSGMTCTGCSTKLINVLNQIDGISKPQVTFVSGSASFDLDPKYGSVNTVLQLIERRTGFKTSRIFEDLQVLDVLMTSDIAISLEQMGLQGIVSVTKGQGKSRDQRQTYQVAYNPYIIGARDLLPPDTSLAPPAPDPSFSEGQKRLIHTGWMTIAAAAFTVPVVVLNWAPTHLPRRIVDIISLILATAVQGIAVPEFYVNAVKSLLFSRIVEMDMLVVISITAAYGYSIVAMGLTEAGYTLNEDAFFETSSLLITLVLLGRLVAAIARTRAINAVSIRSLQVEKALLLDADGTSVEIDGRLLQLGDTIVVRPHSRIITDGTVVSGISAVDESMLTGETVPVTKQKGETVIAGTINGEGGLQVRLTRLPGSNSISDIAKSVESALSAKPKIQDLADKIASWFVPMAVGVAIIVFVIWVAIVAAVRRESAGSVIGTSITYGIAVLAISCPCALGLAVPMVLVIAGGIAARSGIIIRAADATERGFKVTDVVFDKTGTLTKGDLHVAQMMLLASDVSEDLAMAVVSKLVCDDGHPVARAISTHVGKDISTSITLEEVKSVPGAGIRATWNGLKIQGGNPFWLGVQDEAGINQMLDQGMTCFCLTIEGSLVLAFGLTDVLRDETAGVVSALQGRNITAHIVSGDHAKAVDSIARSLNILEEHTASRRLPGQKQQYVASLQESGKVVMFCGDGTNDAVALAQANIGVQLGTASDVAGAVADVVLLGGLDGTLGLLDISKRAFRRIVFNFAWSAAYNVFAILLSSGAFVKFRIPPAYAGLGEIVSVVPVILAAVSLVWGNERTAQRGN